MTEQFQIMDQYHWAKGYITAMLHMPSDSVHIYIGVICLLVAVLCFNLSIRSYWALLPCFIVSVVMETFDVAYRYAKFQGLDLAGSAIDILHTNLIPLLLVLLFRHGWIRYIRPIPKPKLRLTPQLFAFAPKPRRSTDFANLFHR